MNSIMGNRGVIIGAGLLSFALVAGGGSAVARNLIDSGDVKNNSLRSGDILNGNLRGIDIKDGSLTARDFRGDLTGERGPAGADGLDGADGADGVDGEDGARGPQGAQGPQGPAGPAGSNSPDEYVSWTWDPAVDGTVTKSDGRITGPAVIDPVSLTLSQSTLQFLRDNCPDAGLYVTLDPNYGGASVAFSRTLPRFAPDPTRIERYSGTRGALTAGSNASFESGAYCSSDGDNQTTPDLPPGEITATFAVTYLDSNPSKVRAID